MPMSGQLLGLLGRPVVRAAAVIPQTATASIFTVNGGQCRIYLVGRVTTAGSATVTNLTIVNTVPVAANGATTNLSAATAITSTAAGATLVLPATVGGALVIATGAYVLPGDGQVVNPGTIQLTASASNPMAVRWTLYYVPVDNGANVAAA